MKKMILLVLLIASSIQTISSQDKNEQNLMVSVEWHIEYIEMGGQKMDYPAEMKKLNWIFFHKDGKYEEKMGEKRIGTWEFDKKSKIIKVNDLNEKTEFKLISVTKNELIVLTKDEEGVEIIMGLKK